MKTLLVHRARSGVVAEQTHEPAVLAHNDEHFAFFWFTIELLVYHRAHTVVFAAHVVEITQEPEAVYARHPQHSPSRFPTSLTSSR